MIDPVTMPQVGQPHGVAPTEDLLPGTQFRSEEFFPETGTDLFYAHEQQINLSRIFPSLNSRPKGVSSG
jgi:hypothetical protein